MFEPRQITPPYRFEAILSLLHQSFAYMSGRIGPPSSLQRMTLDGIANFAAKETLLIIEHDNIPVACVFLTSKSDHIYIGKLAVAKSHRGLGLARLLLEDAAQRARAAGLSALILDSRVELVEVHAAFAKLGFVQVGTTRHEGFDRPTSIIMRKAL